MRNVRLCLRMWSVCWSHALYTHVRLFLGSTWKHETILRVWNKLSPIICVRVFLSNRSFACPYGLLSPPLDCDMVSPIQGSYYYSFSGTAGPLIDRISSIRRWFMPATILCSRRRQWPISFIVKTATTTPGDQQPTYKVMAACNRDIHIVRLRLQTPPPVRVIFINFITVSNIPTPHPPSFAKTHSRLLFTLKYALHLLMFDLGWPPTTQTCVCTCLVRKHVALCRKVLYKHCILKKYRNNHPHHVSDELAAAAAARWDRLLPLPNEYSLRARGDYKIFMFFWHPINGWSVGPNMFQIAH